MTKQEFLVNLEKRLLVLNEKERDDIISEYSQHIDLKMKSGLKEEEVICDFGNLEELTAEILDAYNVNPDYDKNGIHFSKKRIIKGISSSFIHTGNKVQKITKKCSFRIAGLFRGHAFCSLKRLFHIFLVAAGLFVIYIPLATVDFMIAEGLYSMFGPPFDHIFSLGLVLGFHLFYLFMALSVVYTFMIRTGNRKKEKESDESAQTGDSQRELKREADTKSLLVSFQDKRKGLLLLKDFSGRERRLRKREPGLLLKRLGRILKTGICLCVKGIIFCFFTPVLLLWLFLLATLGTLMVFVILGYPVIGLAVISLGGLLSGFALIWPVAYLLFFRKEREGV